MGRIPTIKLPARKQAPLTPHDYRRAIRNYALASSLPPAAFLLAAFALVHPGHWFLWWLLTSLFMAGGMATVVPQLLITCIQYAIVRQDHHQQQRRRLTAGQQPQQVAGKRPA